MIDAHTMRDLQGALRAGGPVKWPDGAMGLHRYLLLHVPRAAALIALSEASTWNSTLAAELLGLIAIELADGYMEAAIDAGASAANARRTNQKRKPKASPLRGLALEALAKNPTMRAVDIANALAGDGKANTTSSAVSKALRGSPGRREEDGTF